MDRGSEATPAWYSPLTQDEAQVAELLAAGLNNHEVAAHLGISARQLRDRMIRIVWRLGRVGIQLGHQREIGEWFATHRPQRTRAIKRVVSDAKAHDRRGVRHRARAVGEIDTES